MDIVRSHIMVCAGTGCSSSNSPAIIKAFETQLAEKGLDKEVKVVQTGCFGLCAMGPVVLIYPEGAFYTHVTPDDVTEIVEEHIIKGRLVTRLLHKEDEGKAVSEGDVVLYAGLGQPDALTEKLTGHKSIKL